MQLVKLIFLLTPIWTVGQVVDKKGHFDLISNDFSNSRFDIDSSGFKGNIKEDTTYYDDGKIATIQHYAIDKKNIISGNRVGQLTQYYPNGQIRSQGEFAIYSLFYYQSAKTYRRLETSYKVGEWKYYYDNGQVKAKGQYKIVDTKINTGIPNQIGKKAITTDDWLFFNSDGSAATDKMKLIALIEHNPNCD